MPQIGGGIRDYTDSTGHKWSAVEVAAGYFRAGADKVSIGVCDHVLVGVWVRCAGPVEGVCARWDPLLGGGCPWRCAGSDAVIAAEEWYASGCVLTGTTSIEQIARVYGRQAVVISIDPRCDGHIGRVFPPLVGHSFTKRARAPTHGAVQHH